MIYVQTIPNIVNSYRKNCLTIRILRIIMNKLSICIKYILIFRCTFKKLFINKFQIEIPLKCNRNENCPHLYHPFGTIARHA